MKTIAEEKLRVPGNQGQDIPARSSPPRRKRKASVAIDYSSSSPRKRVNKSVCFLGKHVVVQRGRYKGERGYVTYGANGYYRVMMDDGKHCWKRASSISLGYKQDGSQKTKLPGAPPASARTPPCARDVARGVPVMDQKSRVGHRVKVTAGKYLGSFGTICGSGHGYYCVRIPGVGHPMIRGFHLEMCGTVDSETPTETWSDDQKVQAHAPRDEEEDNWEASPEPQKLRDAPVADDRSVGFAASILLAISESFDSGDSSVSETEAEMGGKPEKEETFGADRNPRPAVACDAAPSSFAHNVQGSRQAWNAWYHHELNTPQTFVRDDEDLKLNFDYCPLNENSAVDLTACAW